MTLTRHWRKWMIAAALAAMYWWVFSGIEFGGIKATAGKITRSIVTGLVHPDWHYVYLPDGEDLLRGLLDTLAIAFLGTIISAVLCIPLAFWAAGSKTKLRVFSGSGKVSLGIVRVFPELIMALLFIKAVGPGSFAGALALGVHSVGMLGKLFAEEIENIDYGPAEALLSSGASRFQVMWFAVLPQVLPGFLSVSMYRFEINVRSATILGVIGAGGIGTPLIFALSSRDWDRVGIILLGIIAMVTLIDGISGYLRKKLA